MGKFKTSETAKIQFFNKETGEVVFESEMKLPIDSTIERTNILYDGKNVKTIDSYNFNIELTEKDK